MASWTQTGEDSYKLIAELGRDARGKRLREFDTIHLGRKPKKGELDLEAAKFEEAVRGGKWQKRGVVGFEDFVEGDWKKNYADVQLGEYTRKNYMDVIRTHLLPEFGRYQLDKITTMQIVSFMTWLRTPAARKDGRKKPLATNTQLNVYKALKAILDAAYEWRLLIDNPMDGVKRPRADKAEQRALKLRKKSLTADEAADVIEALAQEPEKWRLYFIGVLLGGFRRGEMLAVEWPALDEVNGGLYVDKQITFDEEGAATEGEVKTVESEGFVPLPRWYVLQLAAYKKTWLREKLACPPDKWLGGDKEYIFHGGYGAVYYPNTPSLRWRKFLARHGLPGIRLHDLRHTTAMLLRKYGADLRTVQEQLRHTKLATTEIYLDKGGVISRGQIDLLDALDPQQKRGHQMVTRGHL